MSIVQPNSLFKKVMMLLEQSYHMCMNNQWNGLINGWRVGLNSQSTKLLYTGPGYQLDGWLSPDR